MSISRWSRFALALVALAQLSCAAGNLTPLSESMPAARAGLSPEYRLFYDALQDYGDWVLIEPAGYLFRPAINMVGWRPYLDGFWAPSDVYGWVWISAEPFGWATYHYGRWVYDRYQGWLWMPGLDWGPAWVAWQGNDQYVGWAPLSAPGWSPGGAPGGGFLYAPTSQMGSTSLRASAQPASALGDKLGPTEIITDQAEVGGVTINLGPRIDRIERKTGPLTRVKLEDIVPPAGTGHPAGVAPAAPAPGVSAGPGTGAASVPAERQAVIESTRRAAQQAAQQARALTGQTSKLPPTLGIVRPDLRRGEPAGVRTPPPGAQPAAPADSARR